MSYVLLILAVALSTFVALRRLFGGATRINPVTEPLSDVTMQHMELVEGDAILAPEIAAARSQLAPMLAAGDVTGIDSLLAGGTNFAVRIRALADIGTEQAATIIERQLERRFTDDPLDHSWYLLDMARSLRYLQRDAALPKLLVRAAAKDDPVAPFLSVEIARFAGFRSLLTSPRSALGRQAIRIVQRALSGVRDGLPASQFAEARLGEALECVVDHASRDLDVFVVSAYVEAIRVIRRLPLLFRQAELAGAAEEFESQAERLLGLGGPMEAYLSVAVGPLLQRLGTSAESDVDAILSALTDLRADASGTVIPMLEDGRLRPTEAVFGLLHWSTDGGVARWIRRWVHSQFNTVFRMRSRPWAVLTSVPEIPNKMPYLAALRSLANKPDADAEALLLHAADDIDAPVRRVALGALGWVDPVHPVAVNATLKQARHDECYQVRRAAEGALARLGECRALHWFRQQLVGENTASVSAAALTTADEGLTWLWPDLHRLTHSDNPEVAACAGESLARLDEQLAGSRMMV